MEEAEVPLENAQEETMHHGGQHGGWVSGVALSSALLAVLAAITALLSGHHANEAVIEQIQASDYWSQYQAKSIKASLLQAKVDLFVASGKEPADADINKAAEYKKEMEDISEQAKEKEQSSADHLEHHQIFARGVTMYQVAIAIAAIAALTRKKPFWLVGLIFGVVGTFFMAQGFFPM